MRSQSQHRVLQVGERLGRYEVEKRRAVEKEDYDLAKEKKQQMARYRSQVYGRLQLHGLVDAELVGGGARGWDQGPGEPLRGPRGWLRVPQNGRLCQAQATVGPCHRPGLDALLQDLQRRRQGRSGGKASRWATASPVGSPAHTAPGSGAREHHPDSSGWVGAGLMSRAHVPGWDAGPTPRGQCRGCRLWHSLPDPGLHSSVQLCSLRLIPWPLCASVSPSHPRG